MVTMEKFVDWLKLEMKKQNLSQAELARRSGVTRSSINGVLTQSRGIGVDLLQDIAKGLKVPIETVYRKVGLLPEKPHDETIERIDYLISTLRPDQQNQVMNFVRFLTEDRGDYETKTDQSGSVE